MSAAAPARRRAAAAAGLAGWVLAAGCGAPESAPPGALGDGADDRVGTLRSAVRPTDSDGKCWYGNCYDVPPDQVRVLGSLGGHFRVWFTVSGTHAVDLTDDAPKDGVPDFVAQVASAAETTYQSTVTQRGYRPPLDDSKWNDGRGFGDDGRFDIYLRWAGTGSDGYRVTEACTDGVPGETPERCAGYFVMNPSYKTSHYGSDRDGIEVLTSHELFHTLQDAYSSTQWRTWAEATAVWNELQVFPTSQGTRRDYLSFLPAFFGEPQRPFDKSMGTGPGTSYAYAAGVWPEYLSERFGPGIIREIWAGCEAQGLPMGTTHKHFLDVTEQILKDGYHTDLATEWAEFTRWNLLTGERADGKRGYGQASGLPASAYPSVKLEQTVTTLATGSVYEIDGMSARYLRFAPQLAKTQKLRLRVSDPGPAPVVTTGYIVPATGTIPGAALPARDGALELELAPGETLLVVLSGAARGARARDVTVQLDDATPVGPGPMPDPMKPEPVTGEGGGCALAGAPAGPGPLGLSSLVIAGAALLRRRRQR